MCLFPIAIKTEDAFGIPVSMSVPCGKCIECFKDRQNSWKIRLCEEFRDHLYCYFFTLTYNDCSVPYEYDDDGVCHRTLRKSDVQLWVKRNRMRFERRLHKSVDFKYFICGEYGPSTGRPHYHGIVFTELSPSLFGMMMGDWRSMYGFVSWSAVLKKKTKGVSAVGNYVAKYCCKPAVFKSAVERDIYELSKIGIIEPTFYIMSKGIGASYVQRMKRWHVPRVDGSFKERITVIADRSFYLDGSFKYKLPRYYRDRFYRMKFPCDSRVWNKKKKMYENKIVYRYKSKNLLALNLQAEIRGRLLAEYDRRVAEFTAKFPNKSRVEIDIEIARSETAVRNCRRSNIYSQMSKFYNYQRFKNKKI